MAIVDSVVIGTGRNKVGEVTLSTVHGRCIARKYQPSVRNPKTQAQTNQRNKMTNALVAYEALHNAVINGFTGRGKYQSVYNAFVSSIIGVMPTVKYTNAMQVVLNSSKNVYITRGNLEYTRATKASNKMVVDITDAAPYMSVGDRIRLVSLNVNGVLESNEEITLTAAMITAGTVQGTKTVGSDSIVCAYWYKENRSANSSTYLPIPPAPDSIKTEK